jgi:hypothetical protein
VAHPRRRAAQGSHDSIRTPLYTPLRIKGSIGVLSDELFIDKWPPREIHKHIVARSLLCDEPSGICRAARSGNSADAKKDRRNTSNRKSFRRPGLTHRMERRSERKFGSGSGVFLLGSCSESGPADLMQISMGGRDHGETASISNCRAARRLRRGE